eukprot:gene13979-15437_t
MTEDPEQMDKKALQPKNIALQKKSASYDAKRCSQKASRKSDASRSSSWSPSLKHQLADNRFQGKTSRKKGTKLQDDEEAKQVYMGELEAEGDLAIGRKDYKKLLNFKFEPPSRCHVGPRVSNKSWKSVKSPVYNKETYLQANCQFVVKDDEDYPVHAFDPDRLVDWNSIKQVNLFSHEMISCPICLEIPVAAKVTKCGHIYCWSCILHYLHLSDKPWRKCPICYEAVAPADLKSVVNTCTSKFARGDKVTMHLMKRKRGSVLSWPVLHEPDDQDNFARWTGDYQASFSKLVIADRQCVHDNIIAREMRQLEDQLIVAKADKTGEECFIETALLKLKEEETKLLEEIHHIDSTGIKDINTLPKTPAPLPATSAMNRKMSALSVDEPVFFDEDNNHDDGDVIIDDEAYIAAVAEGSAEPIEDATESDCINGSTEPACAIKGNATDMSDYFYFYQAEDGQNIFLQPINVRCLIREYGSLEACPEKISAQIMDIEHFTMTKDLRKRYRFLSHLPIACGYSFCELMLRPPILSQETLAEFSGEFHARKLQRQKKKKEERKQEQRIERRKTMDMFGREIQKPVEEVSWNLGSYQEFPSQAGESAPGDDDTVLAQSPVNDSMITSSWGSSSFAQALQSNAKPIAAPKQKSVTRGQPLDVPFKDSGASLNSDGEVEEDYIPVPSFSRAFSDALSASWVNLDSNEDESATHLQPSKRNKKKQKGKKLLFSTGGFMKY